MTIKDKAITVNTLCGKSDLEMAKESILSLQKCSEPTIRHKVFSDGTICDKEDSLKDFGISCIVVSKEEADDRVAPFISNSPRIQKMRQENARTRKTFDIPLLSMDSVVCMADTDVFGIRPYHGLFEVPRELAFNKDPEIANSGRWIDIIRSRRVLPLALHLNSGLYQVSKEIYDLDFFEFALKQSAFFPGTGFLHEQTLWSAFAAQHISKLKLFSPEQVAVVEDKTNLHDKDLCVAHFIRGSRHRIEEIKKPIKNLNPIKKAKPARILVHGGKVISIADVVRDRLKRAASWKSTSSWEKGIG